MLQALAREWIVAGKRRLEIRFCWDTLQLAARGSLLIALVVLGILFIFSEGLPWLGGGFTDLSAGVASPASLETLLIL